MTMVATFIGVNFLGGLFLEGWGGIEEGGTFIVGYFHRGQFSREGGGGGSFH